jgi:hypothetical protein
MTQVADVLARRMAAELKRHLALKDGFTVAGAPNRERPGTFRFWVEREAERPGLAVASVASAEVEIGLGHDWERLRQTIVLGLFGPARRASWSDYDFAD